MSDRILRFAPKGLLLLAILLFVSFVVGDIREMIRVGAEAKAARARAEELIAEVDKNEGQPRFVPLPEDSSQASGRALSPWTDVPRGGGFHSYDFYPR